MNVVHLIAIGIASVACVTDMRTRRIPNVLTFGAAVAALIFHSTAGRAGLVTAVEGWMVGLAIFFVPFALGGLGGGDVKLLAALGAWLGPREAVWIALYAGVAGGVMALVIAVGHGYMRKALANIFVMFAHWRAVGLKAVPGVSLEGSSGPRLAYALPIFCGLVATLWLQ
jgi:prepilin peptidase CpaA